MTQVNGNKERQARVVKVSRDKRPYAAAMADGIQKPVTFSLDPDHHVWKETEFPTIGTRVILSDIRKNDKGWRAQNARFLRPEDEVDQAT